MKPTIVIITGLSGSGKTIALRALEDSSFISVDNLPPQMIDSFANIETSKTAIRKIAVSIDVREKEFLHEVESILSSLRQKYSISVVYLEAEIDVLIRRFKETRRPHPLYIEGKGIEDAIEAEIKLLQPLRNVSDRILDTSSYTPHQLRHLITSLFGKTNEEGIMTVTFISFGYKFGVPSNIDLLLDVRFIPNPYFVPELKDLKGSDSEVMDFVLQRSETEEFIKRLLNLLDFLIPLYIKEGRTYLTIGIGCTGGRHRSPVIVDSISSILKGKSLSVNVTHRDM
ncbi:MAG: RNase adapter RapZ [Nitrospirae bacterium]|nr:RNase adapter RapZ [Nitrospirota bacterium]